MLVGDVTYQLFGESSSHYWDDEFSRVVLGREGGRSLPPGGLLGRVGGSWLQDCIPGVGELVCSFVPVYSLWVTLPDLHRLSDPPMESVVFPMDDLGFVPVHQVVLSLTVV